MLERLVLASLSESQRKITKVSESKMDKFKMTVIIKLNADWIKFELQIESSLSQNQNGVKVFLSECERR